MTVLLYSPEDSARLRYIADYLFSDLLGIPVVLTTDVARFKASSEIAINYSPQRIREQEVHLLAAPLLFEEGVCEQYVESAVVAGVPVCYGVPLGGGLPFDPFAASFFVLSRYEEYLAYQPDQHGRYPAKLSWVTRNGALGRPILWQWLQLLKEAILKAYPEFVATWPERTYRFLPTYDVDIPWAYRYRGWRGWARAAVDVVFWKTDHWRARWRAWRDATKDPYFTFPQLAALHQSVGIRPLIFWLLADRAAYDINPNPELTAFRDLVKQVAAWSEVGIHPSYQQGQLAQGILREKKRLENIMLGPIRQSRQHFLRLSLPTTYRQLLVAGITADYSMGYAEVPGFRAGTSEPFWWYDLEKEERTQLRVHPFAVMDVTLKQYQGFSPPEAQVYLHQLQSYCRTEGLTFCTLWHNSSFSKLHGWDQEWWRVYQSLFAVTGTRVEKSDLE